MLNTFLEGEIDEDKLCLSLPSCAVIFILRYCDINQVNVVLIKSPAMDKGKWVTLRPQSVSDLYSVRNQKICDLPADVAGCGLPVVKDDSDNFIRSGLCSTLRHIVLHAHEVHPNQWLQHLLGFRNGTLKSCAEVSGWTKLCEVDIPQAVENVRKNNRNYLEDKECLSTTVPSEIHKVEAQFSLPVHHFNGDRLAQDILHHLRKTFTRPTVRKIVQEKNDVKEFNIMAFLQKDISKPHCVTKFIILKELPSSDIEIVRQKKRKKKPSESRKLRIAERLRNLASLDHGHSKSQGFSSTEPNGNIAQTPNVGEITSNLITLTVGDTKQCEAEAVLNDEELYIEHVIKFIHSLTSADIHLKHTYLEGINLTLSDLLIFVYFKFFQESVHSVGLSLQATCPLSLEWSEHLISLPRVYSAVEKCPFIPCLINGSTNQEMVLGSQLSLNGTMLETRINHNPKSKCRPIKPDVATALEKIQISGILPDVGCHPCGEDVTLQWNQFPAEVRPFHGDLNKEKARSKCQQLENLVSIVIGIAKPGDIIIDFCCGGGHLGIVIAYMLPQCQVYLIDNKEESLTRAKQRTTNLNLTNVTLFQCNLEYFSGSFNIGVCLHGCGVATDMVLQKCLDNMAAFVVCPCCYGKVQNTHMITYPRSKEFQSTNLSSKEYIMLGHAADQTEIGIELEEQGKFCSNLVDTDRGLLFRGHGYNVTLCSLQPLTCTTKNNLLVGVPP